jgi:hypothetical protein
LTYLTAQIPQAKLLEETTIRWNIAKSSYSDMRDYIAALGQTKAQFRFITGSVQDDADVNALHEVFGKRSGRQNRPVGQLKCFRLHHTSPLMNFVLIYEEHKPTEVLFGYGTHGRDQPNEETPVFRSNNESLVKEFKRLCKVLRSEQFSNPIDVDDPEFLRSRDRKCDVLAKFEDGFPEREIRQRIQDCSQKRIVICTTAWPTLNSFVPVLRGALERNCSIDLALWKPDTPFALLRDETANDPEGMKRAIKSHEALLEVFKGSTLNLHWCDGPGSVTIFWIDDLIYFSPYWVGVYASSGPHFLVRAGSDTGRHLQDQYAKMLPAVERATSTTSG